MVPSGMAARSLFGRALTPDGPHANAPSLSWLLVSDQPGNEHEDRQADHDDQQPHLTRPVALQPDLSQPTTRAAESQPRTIPVAARPECSTHDPLSSVLAVAEDGRGRKSEGYLLECRYHIVFQ
jgi:hypothetical protein